MQVVALVDAALSSTPGHLPNGTLNLDSFDYGAAGAYASAHVCVHVVLFVAVSIGISVTLFALNAASMTLVSLLSAMGLYIARSILVALCTSLRRRLWAYCGCPWLLYRWLCLCECVQAYKDRFVLIPRLFLAIEAWSMFTVQPVRGFARGAARIAMGMLWMLVRMTQFHEPILPRQFSLSDPGFLMHGGMMKARMAGALDPDFTPAAV